MPFTVTDSLRRKSRLFDYIDTDATFTFSNGDRTGIKKIVGGSYTNGGMVTKFSIDQDAGSLFEVDCKISGGTSAIFVPIVMRQVNQLDYTDGYGVMFSASDCSTISPASGNQVIIPVVSFDHWYKFKFKFTSPTSLDIYLDGNLVYTYTNVPMAPDGWYLCIGGSFYEVLTAHYKNFRAVS